MKSNYQLSMPYNFSFSLKLNQSQRAGKKTRFLPYIPYMPYNHKYHQRKLFYYHNHQRQQQKQLELHSFFTSSSYIQIQQQCRGVLILQYLYHDDARLIGTSKLRDIVVKLSSLPILPILTDETFTIVRWTHTYPTFVVCILILNALHGYDNIILFRRNERQQQKRSVRLFPSHMLIY